jgi:hypothetical protein
MILTRKQRLVATLIGAALAIGVAYFITPEEMAEETVQTVTLLNITFDLPSDLSVISIEDETAMISIPHSQYEVTIPFSLKEVDVNTDDLELVGTTAGELNVYFEFCAPAYGCWYLEKDATVYLAVFEIAESTEPVPENLDGIWTPGVEFETKMLEDIIYTAQ